MKEEKSRFSSLLFFFFLRSARGKCAMGARASQFDGKIFSRAERAHITREKFFHTLLRPHITAQSFLLMQERAHTEGPYVTETHEYFHYWNTIPASPTFFPAARKECRPRKGRRPVTPA